MHRVYELVRFGALVTLGVTIGALSAWIVSLMVLGCPVAGTC